jgi:hypothetical protein
MATERRDYVASTKSGIVRRGSRHDSPNDNSVVVTVIDYDPELLQRINFNVLALVRENSWLDDNLLFSTITHDNHRDAVGVAVK